MILVAYNTNKITVYVDAPGADIHEIKSKSKWFYNKLVNTGTNDFNRNSQNNTTFI